MLNTAASAITYYSIALLCCVRHAKNKTSRSLSRTFTFRTQLLQNKSVFSVKPRWDDGEIEINDMRLTLQPIPAPPQLAEEQTLLQWRRTTTSIESGSSLRRRPKKVAMGRCQSLVGGCYYSWRGGHCRLCHQQCLLLKEEEVVDGRLRRRHSSDGGVLSKKRLLDVVHSSDVYNNVLAIVLFQQLLMPSEKKKTSRIPLLQALSLGRSSSLYFSLLCIVVVVASASSEAVFDGGSLEHRKLLCIGLSSSI